MVATSSVSRGVRMKRKFRSETAARRVARVLGMKITGRATATKLKDGTKAKMYTFVKVKKGKKRR